MNRTFKFTSLLAGVTLIAACGDSLPTGVNSGDQPTPAEVDLLVSALFGDLEDLGTGFAAARQPNVPLPAGLSFSVAGVPINETFSESSNCSGGGTVTVDGSVNGDFNQESGEGSADFEVTQRIRSCIVTGEGAAFTVTSDPDIQAEGTLEITETSFSLTLDIGGGLSFITDDDRTGTCAIDISLSVTATQTGDTQSANASISGSVCGRSVNDL